MEQDGEDAVLAGLLRGAAALCEQFVGQWLIARDARETVAGGGGWQRLAARPVLGHGSYRGPVRGLYMCGAGTHPGGGVTGAPGHNAARAVLKDGALWRRWRG